MPYILYKSNGQKLATISDGSVDRTTTSLSFVGKNYAGYGEILNENLVKLLENFSNATSPSSPVIGQLWYDTSQKKLTVYDGSRFRAMTNVDLGSARPNGSVRGDLWFNEYEQKLYFNNGTRYVLIGPQISEFTGVTIEASSAVSNDDLEKFVLKATIADDLKREVVAVLSRDQFIPYAADDLALQNFPSIKQGISLPGADLTTGKSWDSGYYFWGTAAHTLRLGEYAANEYLLAQTFNDAINYGLTIPNDAGVVIGAPIGMLQIHSDNASQEGKITVVNGNKLSFNTNVFGNPNTNIFYIENFQIKPNTAYGGVDLGVSGARFAYGWINTVTSQLINVDNVSIYQKLTTPNISNTNLSTTNVIATTITATTFIGSFKTGTGGNFLGDTVGKHTGNIETSLIEATGGTNTSFGQIRGAWKLISNSTLEATFADLAERYYADSIYDEGTVLVIGGPNEVTITNVRGNVAVAGIVSNNPAFKMNSDAGNNDTHPYIALKGRVPCKVVGIISKGDLLVTAQTPGFGTAFNDQIDSPNAVFGTALEDYPGGNGFGIIEVKV
jgi:hypothetical protein